MASYKVVIAASAEKDLRSIPFPTRRQLNQRLMKLRDGDFSGARAFPDGASYALLLYGWRVLFAIDDETKVVDISAIVKD